MSDIDYEKLEHIQTFEGSESVKRSYSIFKNAKTNSRINFK